MNYNVNFDKIKVREEKNGTYSFLNLESMKIVFLNKIASFVYLHPEINNLNDLAKAICNNFDVPSIEEVTQDCKDLLHKMNALDLICITDEARVIDTGCCIVGEEDYKKASEFINENFTKNGKVIMYSSLDLNYYSPYALRARQFNNKEYNFIYYDELKNIQALITLGVGTISSYTVLNIFADRNDLNMIKELLEYAFNATPNLTKMRISIKNDKSGKILQNYVEKIGFTLEAILKDEYGKGIDLLCYSKFRS